MTNAKSLQLDKPYRLESGAVISKPRIAYHTYGTLNADASNVIWVCHALTANSEVFDWWNGLFGEDKIFNPNKHFIICANILGSHYGTTGPLSENPDTGTPYYHDFPTLTIRDIVGLHIELADHLNINKIKLLIGGSIGGHQTLEWAIMQPDRILNMCAIATSPIISPWASAFNQSQRMAIETDPTWNNSDDQAGIEGMKVARSIALLSYRNYQTYDQSQQQDNHDDTYQTRAASYQEYQGLKLSKRFNAFSYWHISKAMDSQNVGRNRDSIQTALSYIKARTLILSLEEDILFPYQNQKLIADNIIGAEHSIIKSTYGHDGFLLETEQIGNTLRNFLSEVVV